MHQTKKEQNYNYDEKGNITNKQETNIGINKQEKGTRYQYNQGNLLIKEIEEGEETTYTYDVAKIKSTKSLKTLNKKFGVKIPSKLLDEGASGAKIVKNADDVVYNESSIDKAFSKHGQDFGKYLDGSKTSVNAFTNDVKSLINNGTQVKGTYRTTLGTHVYNPSTKQWAFINADGTFNTAFKLSDSQYKYLIETGVIK